MSHHDTEHRSEPVCPNCGYHERDFAEIDFGPGLDGDARWTCNSCGEELFVSRHVTTSFTTRRIRPCR